MMLTDKLLAAAAAEVNEAMLRGLPEPGDCAPEFSTRFEWKMRRVLRRGNHPAAYRVMQRAASIVLVLLIGFASILAVSPTVRANVWGWIRERYESWVIYRYEDSVPSDVEVIEYKLTDLPEGYTEIRRSNMPDIETIVYEDADGSFLFFSYSKNPEAIMYLVKAEGYAIEEIEVRDMKGEVYSAEDASNSNCIIWSDDTENTMFYISGYFNREELIDLAESVCRNGEDQTLEKPVKYVMTALPERYTNIMEFEEYGNYIATYADEEGQVLNFSYGSGNTGSIYIEEKGYDVTSFTICGQQADLYMAIDASNSNGIIWGDRNSGTIFSISAYLDRDELIELAESVRRADGYLLTGLPDGYTMVDAREDSERYISVFINEKEAQMIDFTYGFTDLYLGMDGYDIVPAMVDGKEAELYLSREQDRNNSVIWSDKETRLIFHVSAPMEQDELIALAESVEPIG